MSWLRRFVHRYRHDGPDPLAQALHAALAGSTCVTSAHDLTSNFIRTDKIDNISPQSVAGQLDAWRTARRDPAYRGM